MEVWQTITTVALTALITGGITGVIVHLLTARRDEINRQREERITYRIGAYRALAATVNREALTSEQSRAIEGAVDDILLFGNQKEVDAVTRFMSELAKEQNADLDEVLDVLRANLRAELKESKAPIPADARSLRLPT